MCSGGSTQVWPLTAERSRVGRSASILCPAPGSLAPFAGKLRRKSILFLEGFFIFSVWPGTAFRSVTTDRTHYSGTFAQKLLLPVTALLRGGSFPPSG